jgi:hypothetical protein
MLLKPLVQKPLVQQQLLVGLLKTDLSIALLIELVSIVDKMEVSLCRWLNVDVSDKRDGRTNILRRYY